MSIKRLSVSAVVILEIFYDYYNEQHTTLRLETTYCKCSAGQRNIYALILFKFTIEFINSKSLDVDGDGL